MLYIEKGGVEQIEGELAAYNPLIPNGRELIATMMIEIPDPEKRQKSLAKLGGIEETISLILNGTPISGLAEEDVDRTSADGKASSVQFIHFPFTGDQISAFSDHNVDLRISVEHSNYRHSAGLLEEAREALATDFLSS